MTHERVEIEGLELSATVAGDRNNPALVLLHGWPQTSYAWRKVVEPLGRDSFVLAFDLPGVGDSRGLPRSAEKTVLADIVLSAAEKLGARDILIVGYDVGGMISYAAARDHCERIAGAVVMNTVIPGLDPWDKLLADPRVWHFAFHLIPGLPETLVDGRQRAYFDFFYDVMSRNKQLLTDDTRDVYARGYGTREALKAGFDWYRAMPKDAEHNRVPTPIDLPLLYVRGDADGRTPEDYLPAMRQAGTRNASGAVFSNSGEYAPEEVPDELVRLLVDFRKRVMAEACRTTGST